MHTTAPLEHRLRVAEHRLSGIVAENTRARRIQRMADILRPAPRFDQAEISAAFATARRTGLADGEDMLRALRQRQVSRDLTATSFGAFLR